MDIKNIFPVFVRSLKDAELIDKFDLKKLKTISDPKKADYFFDSRRIICEQKALDKDMLAKFEREINDIIANKGVRLYGRLLVDEILNRFPDSENLRKRVFMRLTKSIEGAFETAHRQIRNTKALFDLYSSKGVLLVLNTASYLFSPDILMRKFSEMFNKKTSDGRLRYDEIDAVWIIQVSHHMTLKRGIKAFPSIKLLNNIKLPEADLEYVSNYLELLERQFAAFSRMPYLTGTPEKTSFKPTQMPSIKIK